MAKARTVRGGSALPLTQPWSHPGTYLTEMGLRLGGLAVYLQAGRYADGLTAMTLTGEPLLAGQSLSDGLMKVTLSQDGHSAEDHSPLGEILHRQLRWILQPRAGGITEFGRGELTRWSSRSKCRPSVGVQAKERSSREHMLMDYWVSSAVEHSD